ncbi:RNA-guided endonuclease InsQ/TnpB family protein [Vibrio vulnificus]
MRERAYKYRIYPTGDQVELLERTFGCVRFVYNSILRFRTDAFYNENERVNYNKASRKLTELKKEAEFNWLNDVSCVPLQQSLRHQQTAFKNFFEGRAKYPQFKKKRSKQSAEFTKSAFKYVDGKLYMAKSKQPLDVRWSRDFTHKLTTQLINENQVISCESLVVKNMIKNRKLSKAIADANWCEFVRQLEYKAEWYGRTIVKIDQWYPSSKRCNCCGHVVDSLPLHIRNWRCPECSTQLDRDTNAALNIKAVGLTVLACGA